MTTGTPKVERIPTICFCGRTHAPWWGRYVPAPSCTLSPRDEAFAMMMAWGRKGVDQSA